MEVGIALKQMKGRKGLGSNGLQACFLHKYLNVLGDKVTRMFLGILNNGEDIVPLIIHICR